MRFTVLLVLLFTLLSLTYAKRYTINFEGLLGDFCGDGEIEGCVDPTPCPGPDELCPECPTVCYCPGANCGPGVDPICPSECPSASPEPCPSTPPTSSPCPEVSPCPTDPTVSPCPSLPPSPSPCPICDNGTCPIPSPCPDVSPCPSTPPTSSPCPSASPLPFCPIGQDLICSGECPPLETECPGVTPIPFVCPGEAEQTNAKVGILFARSGHAAATEIGGIYGALLAIQEINNAGGLSIGNPPKRLPIVPIIGDTSSDPILAKEQVTSRITRDCVSVIVGLGSSAQRKEALSVIEEHDSLLLQPARWEGAELHPNVFHVGGVLSQYVRQAVDYAFDSLGRNRFYLIGADDITSRVIHYWARAYIAQRGGQVIGEDFIPLGTAEAEDDFIFGSQGLNIGDWIRDIQPCATASTRCMAILSSIYGQGTQRVFFNSLTARFINPDIKPVISLRMSEYDIKNVSTSRNHYVASNYLGAITTPANENFKARMTAFLASLSSGTSLPIITDVFDNLMVNSYYAVHLWARAVTAAASTNPAIVKNFMRGINFGTNNGPMGQYTIDDENTVDSLLSVIGRILRAPAGTYFEARAVTTSQATSQLYLPPPSPQEYQAFIDNVYTNVYNQRWQGPAFN